MTRAERAMQIWPILVMAAYERRIYTYGQIANMIGINGAGVLGSFLGPIMFYCQHHDLPPLTVLVVNQVTGMPGEGLTTLDNINQDHEAVFNHPWLEMLPVQVSDLQVFS